MKKVLVGALIGAFIVFAWQAVSHMFFAFHDTAYRQIPNQFEVQQMLPKIFAEDGQYLVPAPDYTASENQKQQFYNDMSGKPWALITYHSSLENENMGMSSARSFSTAFLSVLLFILILGNQPGKPLSIFAKTLGLGILIFSFVYYNMNIWMQTPWSVIRPELYDLLIEWALCGIWLGYWLSRKEFQKHF